jgi:succinoglycan biosynthesis protein ExoV
MLLYRWQGETRNFGDELNTLIWPRLLPGFFDENPAELFLGIGSVLDSRHPSDALKIVAGAGYGGYQPKAALDARWVIHWVRGPRTAHAIGLDGGAGLGDPAMLLTHAGWATSGNGDAIGFMPHFESLGRGAWHEAADTAGVQLIDPRDEPPAVIAAIRRCRLLLTEALHGAIAADTLRVPWVALTPLLPIHHAKWHDWADTLGMRIEFRPLRSSSLLERLHATHFGHTRRGRALISAGGPSLRRLARRHFTERAAIALHRATAATPQLSASASLEACQARMLERLEGLRRQPRLQHYKPLLRRADSAYQPPAG